MNSATLHSLYPNRWLKAKMGHIVGLDNWDVDVKQSSFKKKKIQANIYLHYPSYQELAEFAPEERVKIIKQTLRDEYQKLKTLFRGVEFVKLGSNTKPRGISLTTTFSELKRLEKKTFVGDIFINEIEDASRKDFPAVESFWSVKARFVIQIENRKSGIEDYEDRILLIKAFSAEEAESKLLKTFDDYAEPYLNSTGHMVRWKFEEFLDTYSTLIETLEEFNSDEGVEVFSDIRGRRMRHGTGWNPVKK